MATTRIISMHINKGKTIAQCLKVRVDYIENPEKTNGGELISSYVFAPVPGIINPPGKLVAREDFFE